MSDKLNRNIDQAKAAYRYIKGDRTIAWDPTSGAWISLAPGPGDDLADGLSHRALSRIRKIQDAERRGLISHDQAEAEILTIVREES